MAWHKAMTARSKCFARARDGRILLFIVKDFVQQQEQ